MKHVALDRLSSLATIATLGTLTRAGGRAAFEADGRRYAVYGEGRAVEIQAEVADYLGGGATESGFAFLTVTPSYDLRVAG